MRMRGAAFLIASLVALGGCGSTETELFVRSFPVPAADPASADSELKPGIYYIEASGNVNVPGMGAIIYIKKKSEEGPPVVTLVSGISPNIWQQVLPALISAGGFVAGNAVHGLSLKAAQTAVNTAVTATGGKVCTESGSGDLAGC